MRHFVFFCCFLFPVLAFAQAEDCCCCDFRKKGQVEYDAGRYQTAIKKWELGLRCTDKNQCNDLNTLIKKANKKLSAPKPKKESGPPKPVQGEKPAKKETPVASDLVFIKGGTFQMGDMFGEGFDNEKPVHTVTMSNFYLAKQKSPSINMTHIV